MLLPEQKRKYQSSCHYMRSNITLLSAYEQFSPLILVLIPALSFTSRTPKHINLSPFQYPITLIVYP